MGDDLPLAFAQLLRRYREAAGLSQEALAERAGLSPGGIGALERGVRRAPQRQTVVLLANALGLTAADRAALDGAIARRRGPRHALLPSTSGCAPVPLGVQEPASGAGATPAFPPSGTVTFLFTDVEGSTRLLEAHPRAYREAVMRHHALLRGAVERHGGAVFETVGDAVYAAFVSPAAAVGAALDGQRALRREAWGDVGELRVRMGVHTGEVEAQGARYFGAPLYRCARLMAAAHGGQVLLSEATVALAQDALPAGADLRDLGPRRLKDLSRPERVAQLVHPDLPADLPPPRLLDALPHNLPRQVTSFVGRAHALADVARRLASAPLLTLVGPGGVGKTRLALRVAAEVAPSYPDGAWIVELAGLADPELVHRAVAAVLGVREEPGRPLPATLTAALQAKQLLLVLDNCEHLVEACARLADALVRGCPDVRLLATSREPLGIAGEAPWRVPPLTVPALPGPRPPPSPQQPGPVEAEGMECEAIQLFVERAATARPGFALTDRSAPAVADICRRLDGIPLAIELAAARLTALTVEQLLGRLEDRFRLLTGGSRTALPRQQTLRDTVEWSYGLLPPPERALFDRLSVFAGGWTLEAAEAVCAGSLVPAGEVLELLARLVDKSLVLVEDGGNGAARYRLLETLRQFGREQLAARGETDRLRARHAVYFWVVVASLRCTSRSGAAGAAGAAGASGSTGSRRSTTICAQRSIGPSTVAAPGWGCGWAPRCGASGARVAT